MQVAVQLVCLVVVLLCLHPVRAARQLAQACGATQGQTPRQPATAGKQRVLDKVTPVVASVIGPVPCNSGSNRKPVTLWA